MHSNIAIHVARYKDQRVLLAQHPDEEPAHTEAQGVSWAPQSSGLCGTFELSLNADAGRLVLAPSQSHRTIAVIILLVALLILAGCIYPVIESGELSALGPVLLPILLAGLGGAIWRRRTPCMVFNASDRTLWTGRDAISIIKGKGHQTSLADVCAIQCIQKEAWSRHKKRHQYDSRILKTLEINLVCEDGRRIYVTDMDDLSTARQTIIALAELLQLEILSPPPGFKTDRI